MANADAIEREYGFTDGKDDDIDSEADDDVAGMSSSSSKLNGSANVGTDRYGFVGGDQYTDPDNESRVPVHVLRKREVKWLDMLENWEKWMSKRFKKVKDRCRKGIPPALRARAWQYLCGSKFLMEHNRGRFDEYCRNPGDPKCIDEIEKDLHRQFPFHEMFVARGGSGQEDLFMVLKAYSVHNPVDGYCQGQAPLAAVLLMHMPAEQAFWCLVSICEKYLPGYYSMGLEAVRVDGDVLFGLIKRVFPTTYKFMKKQKIDPILYMTEWFMCVFSRTLPWGSVLRVWDMFFCEGVKVMFRISLTLFKCVLSKPEQLAECPSMFETVEKLRKLPPEILEQDFLIRESLKLPINERDMEKEHQYQITKRKIMKEKARKAEAAAANPSGSAPTGKKKKGKSKHATDDS